MSVIISCLALAVGLAVIVLCTAALLAATPSKARRMSRADVEAAVTQARIDALTRRTLRQMRKTVRTELRREAKAHRQERR